MDITNTPVIYDRQEVYDATLDYFSGDVLATDACINKYLMKNDKNEHVEKTPDDMHWRLANKFAEMENRYDNPLSAQTIYDCLKGFGKIIPAGSAMYGIGNEYTYTSIANCFYIGSPADSYGGICRTDEQLLQLMKRRGGVGLSLASLRPEGSPVSNSAGSSTGAVSFAHRFSNSTRECAQKGRRGALMEDLDCRHPDLEQFMMLKRDDNFAVTGANISVKWTDDFLKAVEDGEQYTLRWPVDKAIKDAEFTKVIETKDIWDKFLDSNWRNGDPGCLFWDNTLKYTISDCYTEEGFGSMGVNPCAEIILSKNGACILIALNLMGFVVNGKFDFPSFKEAVRINTRLADDMIDIEIDKCKRIIEKIERDPEPIEDRIVELDMWKEILQCYINGRRVGAGVVSLGDTIASCGIKYDSEEALTFVEKIFKTKNEVEYIATADMAKERGAFPIWSWEKEKNHPTITALPKAIRNKIQTQGRRNINISTIAPTGTIALMTQTTSGVEPLFSYRYTRRRKIMPDELLNGVTPDSIDPDGEKYVNYKVLHKPIQTWLDANPGKTLEESPWFGCSAHDIDWKYRVKLQALIQRYIGHSISSTVNVPHETTREEIGDIYLGAWRDGCKGITIFRDNCEKMGILLSDNHKEEKKGGEDRRPEILSCDIHYSNIAGNGWIFFVGLDKETKTPYEIFGGCRDTVEIPTRYKSGWIKKNKRVNGNRQYDLILGDLENGEDRFIVKDIASTFAPTMGTATRSISLMLRHNIEIQFICEQLYKDSANRDLYCFEKGVARVLKKYISEGTTSTGLCPKCEIKLRYQDGCVMCTSCGLSKCD